MNISAGRLNQRLTIENPTAGEPDARGERTIEWEEVAVVWGCVEPVGPRWLEVAKQFASTVTHKVTIRHKTDINIRQRFVLGERVLAINGIVDPSESHETTVCYCTERQ